jgi:hypothetical protein
VNFGTVKVESKRRVAKLTNTAKKKPGTAVTFAGATVAGSNEFSASTKLRWFGGNEGQMLSQNRFCSDSPGSGQRHGHGQWERQ